MKNELNYKELAHKILMLEEHLIPDNIDAYYNESPLKGVAFFSCLINGSRNNWALKSFPKRKQTFWNHCKKRIEEIEQPVEVEKKLLENPYPRIFKNPESFLFFQSLKNDVRERCKLADYSFIYRRMQKDGYISKHAVDTEFRDFLHNAFAIEIDKTKLLDYCKTLNKESTYTSKKGLFKNL
jgi:hypothetical protein